MRQENECTRRDFTKRMAGAALAAAVAGTTARRAAHADDKPAATRPRISCVSWCFHGLGGRTPRPDQAIETIGELGFEGIELILPQPGEIADYWTDDTVDRLRKRLEHFKLKVPQFALFQPVVEGLTSTAADERQKALDNFDVGCRLAAALGAPLVNIVAPWPREMKGPGSYLPRYYDISNPKPGQKFHIDIAPSFDWDKVWETFVASVRGCLERAKARGLKFTVENHTHTMLPDTGSMLRLWDTIRDPALGFNLDLGWIALDREYPPLAVRKIGKHLMNVHGRDIDGLMRRFVHVGQGVMDFRAIGAALKAVGYHGFVSLEQDGQSGDQPGDMQATCKRYIALMRECLE